MITLISLAIISIAFLASIFCYFLVPDNSPNANLQIPQIALSRPGEVHKLYRQRILQEKNQNIVDILIYGKHNPYKYYPVDHVQSQNQNVIIKYGVSQFALTKQPDDIIINKKFYLGTDKYGRDVLSRLIVGLRISLLVGFFAAGISLVLGVFFGLLSGFWGGLIDKIIMFLINVSWSIPTLLLAFAILLVMERGVVAVYVAVGLTLWVDLARLIRGQVLNIRNREFITALELMDMPSFQVLFRHILPNLYGTILIMVSINFATAILVEAGLSYLGLGVQPPVPSLGNLLKENYSYITSGHVSISLTPALAIVILVLSFNIIGSKLKDVLK